MPHLTSIERVMGCGFDEGCSVELKKFVTYIITCEVGAPLTRHGYIRVSELQHCYKEADIKMFFFYLITIDYIYIHLTFCLLSIH